MNWKAISRETLLSFEAAVKRPIQIHMAYPKASPELLEEMAKRNFIDSVRDDTARDAIDEWRNYSRTISRCRIVQTRHYNNVDAYPEDRVSWSR